MIPIGLKLSREKAPRTDQRVEILRRERRRSQRIRIIPIHKSQRIVDQVPLNQLGLGIEKNCLKEHLIRQQRPAVKTNVVRATLNKLQNLRYGCHGNRPPLPATIGLQATGKPPFQNGRRVAQSRNPTGQNLPSRPPPIAEMVSVDAIQSSRRPHLGWQRKVFDENTASISLNKAVDECITAQRIILAADEVHHVKFRVAFRHRTKAIQRRIHDAQLPPRSVLTTKKLPAAYMRESFAKNRFVARAVEVNEERRVPIIESADKPPQLLRRFVSEDYVGFTNHVQEADNWCRMPSGVRLVSPRLAPSRRAGGTSHGSP